MTRTEFILIAQGNIFDYEGFSALPLDRLELFRSTVFPRMVLRDGQLVSHMDYLNLKVHGRTYAQADEAQRRDMYNIWNLPGMAGLHLGNLLAANGFEVVVINNIDSEWERFQQAYAAAARPPLVGVSSTFFLSWTDVGRIARRLRELDPEMDIALGGAFASGLADADRPRTEKALEKHGIRYLLTGFHSERDLMELLAARRKGCGEQEVKNLCLRQAGEPRSSFSWTAQHWHAPMLEEAPPTWDRSRFPFLRRTVQLRTATGCPFSCAFCSYPVTSRTWDLAGIPTLKAHLDALTRMGGVEQIIFIDDTFNIPQKRFLDILKLLCEYNFGWYSFLRVQFLDEQSAALMKASGCRGVYLGLESADNAVLANMNKKATAEDFARGVALLNKHDIDYLAAFVLGFPGETERSIQRVLGFIQANGVPYYSLKEFYYMQGTTVHSRRADFQLEGMGNRWSHATMTSTQASAHKLELISSITSSIQVDPDTSLWQLAHLADMGHGRDEIRSLHAEIDAAVKRSLAS